MGVTTIHTVLTWALMIACILAVNAANSGQGQAKTCAVHCAKCIGKSGKCQRCDVGYFVDSAKGHTCTAVPSSNCAKFCKSGCKLKGKNKCDSTCYLGYILVNYVCRSCDVNCILEAGCKTQGAGRCDGQCIEGYVLDTQKHICRACGAHCVSGCQHEGAYRCDSQCEGGWVLDTERHICLACDANCDPSSGCQQNGPASCDGRCNTGYALYQREDRPPICRICQSSCTGGCERRGPALCDGECLPGYRYNDTSFMCEACSSNCDPDVGCQEAGSQHCDSCIAGYYLDPVRKACYPCDPHCEPSSGCDQSGAHNCDGPCMHGYTLENKHCF